MLDTFFFEGCASCGIQLCTLTAIFHIYFIHIVHQVKSLFFTDIFVKCTAKVVCDVVFAVRKGTCTTKTAHNGTAFAVDTAFDFYTVNRAVASVQRMT